ncbi:MAG: polysaccharide deacetylase family protein [bacterium]|nr:polysaccharide deacetylase family protein [bacterium]
MYHRIAEERFDPWDLCVTPAHFDEHMALLAAYRAQTDLVSLNNPQGLCDNGSRVAVTFDDGYVDNITHALPVLEKYDIPATIFVVAGAIGRKREFWWDALARAIFEGAPENPVLKLRLPTGTRMFHLDEKELGRSAEAASWRPDHMEPKTSRQRLFLDMWNIVVVLATAAQDDALDQILDWACCAHDPLPNRLPASEEAIVALAQHPLIRIGSHTQDHVSLTDLSPEEQWRQIEAGHRHLEALIGQTIDRFSYPFGRLDDSARRHIAHLGVEMGCCSLVGVVTGQADRFAMPRLQVTDRNGAHFKRWLNKGHGLLVGEGR